jgi:hypothetical protein
MEETNNSLASIAPFLDKELTTMYAVGTYQGYSVNDPNIAKELYGAMRSKFTHLNVFNQVIDSNMIDVVVFFEHANVSILDYDIPVSPGSFLATTKEIDFSKLSHVTYKHFVFGYGPRTDTKFGNGSTEYEVTVLIRDNYTIKVFADSEEEALQIADTVEVHDWEHPVVPEDSHLQDRRMMRHCRWGNLSVRKV